MQAKKKAIFLDRDGILNKEIGDYVYLPEQLTIPPDVPAGIAKLKAAGYVLIVVTNQGGIDRGIYTTEQMRSIHAAIQAGVGGLLDTIYYSPHHKSVTLSLLSKPNSMMIEKGVAKHNIDLAQSYLVGDAERDLQAAHKVGLRAILLPTLKEQSSPLAAYVAKDFAAAVDYILANP